jgi:hypothetical protein
MPLGWGDEADRAVTVLVVVPLDQRGGPGPGGRNVGERLEWVDYILDLTSGVTGRIVELLRQSARVAPRATE